MYCGIPTFLPQKSVGNLAFLNSCTTSCSKLIVASASSFKKSPLTCTVNVPTSPLLKLMTLPASLWLSSHSISWFPDKSVFVQV